jgi:hypothetical protein
VVTGGNLTWCRITNVLETEADVTVDAACVNLWLGPQTAVGIPTTLAVHLTRPLADRIVRDVFGYPVRRDPPPSHAIDQDRAASIAREVLRAESPDVADSATKLMDLVLDRGPSGRPAWKANMIVIEEPPASPGYPSSIWMWIDAESGVVTIISRT